MTSFDLLTLVEEGGCSAKMPPMQLDKLLAQINEQTHPDMLVGPKTHDDASVWKISDDLAIIQTTDFFPPLCSDPFEFGQIAAANALSDVYAMGGRPVSALNLVMFPSSTVDIGVLSLILEGGLHMAKAANIILTGGHTIDDPIPKYGLAVTGVIHPKHITSNANAVIGDLLVLTKPIGTGVMIAGHKLGEVAQSHYRNVLESMKKLNQKAATVMQQFSIQCATDITGFGLAGHAYKMAKASEVSIELYANKIPLFEGVYDLLDMGCIPGAAFRNYHYLEQDLMANDQVDYHLKMALFDAQTSGGLLMCVKEKSAPELLNELKKQGLHESCIVGKVLKQESKRIFIR